MINIGSTLVPQVLPAFQGADPGLADNDAVETVRGNDPIVMENRLNAVGAYQSATGGRSLSGFQIAGGGKGNDFLVTLLFSRTGTGLSANFPQTGSVAGLRVFLYSGSTELELNVRKLDALARARAFVNGHDSNVWMGFEMAGATDGPEFMGMFVIYRGAVIG